MKKLFISVPMKGRTEAEIRASIAKMKTIAEAYEGEELELIDSYVEDTPPANNHQAIWYLGKSLEKLSIADVFITIDDAWSWNGCQIETEVARLYGIKTYRAQSDAVVANYRELVEKNFNCVCAAPKEF